MNPGLIISRLLAVVALVAVPVFMSLINAQTTSPERCEAIGFLCPVVGGCRVTSGYNPARKHPVSGKIKPHTGADIAAPLGTDILAAADGVVDFSGSLSGYGQTVTVRHPLGNTAYAHLQKILVEPGAAVKAGQVIGKADSTGTSAGSHLHFEYLPNRKLVKGEKRVDPAPCFSPAVSGSIEVRDNGTAADDSFRVSIDGLPLGDTPIGQPRSFAISNLVPGVHVLTVTTIVAPDNLGTLQITLTDGWTFEGGATFVSTTTTQGETRTFRIVVPAS